MVFIKSSKNEVWTLPPDIRDLFPSDHICYLVESFVDKMDFSEFEIRYDGIGFDGSVAKIIFLHFDTINFYLYVSFSF